MTTIDNKKHRFKRKLITGKLGEDALLDFQPRLLQHIDIFCDRLAENCTFNEYNEPRNMIELCE